MPFDKITLRNMVDFLYEHEKTDALNLTQTTQKRCSGSPCGTRTYTKKKFKDPSPTFEFTETVVPLPFCYGHSMFYQFWYQYCKDEGESFVLAGSAALQQRMADLDKASFVPNDVDFFTSARFKQMDVHKKIEEFNMCQDKYKIELQQTMDRSTGSLYYKKGIHSVWNFKLTQYLGNKWYAPVMFPSPQIICMKTCWYRGRDTLKFVDEVLDGFDISVCKCAIINPIDMKIIYSQADGDIKNKVLEYDMRNFVNAGDMQRRLTKYIERGFNIDRIRLERKVIIEADDAGGMRVFVDYKQEQDGKSDGAVAGSHPAT
jgi:hypothetical protein